MTIQCFLIAKDWKDTIFRGGEISLSIRLLGFCVLVFHLFAFMAPGSAFAGSDGFEGACNAKLSDRGPYQLSSLNMFERLGLPANGAGVDRAVLKQAYRKAAQVLHPDRGGTSWAFQQISEAYKQLEAEVPERLEASTKVNYDEVDLALMSLGEIIYLNRIAFLDIGSVVFDKGKFHIGDLVFDKEKFRQKTRGNLWDIMTSYNDRAYHKAIFNMRQTVDSNGVGLYDRYAAKYVLKILAGLNFRYAPTDVFSGWPVEKAELVRVIHEIRDNLFLDETETGS